MNSSEIFSEVFNSNSKMELHKLVTKNQYLKDSNNWYPYGGINKDDKV